METPYTANLTVGVFLSAVSFWVLLASFITKALGTKPGEVLFFAMLANSWISTDFSKVSLLLAPKTNLFLLRFDLVLN